MSIGQHRKDDELREQIQNLKTAIDVAVCNSSEVARALHVLHRSGREVQIEIDAVLVNGELEDDSSAVTQPPESDRMSMFDAADESFLQTLNISVL